MENYQPGLIVLLGSGETLPSSGKAHEFVARRLPPSPTLAVVETPAGFELNAGRVAGKIVDFLRVRLSNYQPVFMQIPARKKGTDLSPDDPQLAAPLLRADEILLGPGSPTYAVRQLNDSLVYRYIQARHRVGAALVLSSAATLAFGRSTIPVYEIYKVGEELHWKAGLNFFAQFGLNLTIVPHWNNNDGGAELDTSRCYIGRSRFDALHSLLPKDEVVLGIDDHTSVVLDLNEAVCQVMGNGTVTILQAGEEMVIPSGDQFPLSAFGAAIFPEAGDGLDPGIWQLALDEAQALQREREAVPEAPQAVLDLVEERSIAREAREWGRADQLRDEIAKLGWQVMDTEEGAEIAPIGDA